MCLPFTLTALLLGVDDLLQFVLQLLRLPLVLLFGGLRLLRLRLLR